MNTSHLLWLLHCADRLNPDQSYPVNLRKLLSSLGVELRKEVSASGHVSGLTRKKASLDYQVVLMRSSNQPRRLTARERFTLAHELGHILLDVRLHWQPKTKDEYHLREEWCNRFAARLLVPASVLGTLSIDDPADALQSAVAVSKKCRVSLQMAARRLAELSVGLVFFALVPLTDGKGRRTFRVRWSTQDVKDLGISRGRQLPADAPWNALAVDLESRNAGLPVRADIEPWGSAAALKLARANAQPSLISALVPFGSATRTRMVDATIPQRL